eukprot:TRINITY_DN8097_c0_g1_i2.p1 TRINITY_DN8097_c0_g1~~TRINITY_DN8097_c0_g1_i2.p1  ORF type:complete len:1071 (-),score=226.10 TRINITY_DN8097_c0_g1_i2:68-3049(-)
MATSEDDPRRQKQLKMIRNCSTRLLDLVTNIMDVSSIRSNELKLNRSPCDITNIIDETIQLLKHATDKHGKPVLKPTVKLENCIAEGSIPIIQADTHRVTQVFFNLVMNALKFTMKGQITLTSKVEQEKNRISVCVADTGIGISAIDLDRIFEPFEQAEDEHVNARTFEGIGLGLSISREVVRCHGGDIYVESKVGEGSKFHVMLPIVHKDDKAGEKEQAPRAATEPVPPSVPWTMSGNSDDSLCMQPMSTMRTSAIEQGSRQLSKNPVTPTQVSRQISCPDEMAPLREKDLKGLTVLAIDDVFSSLEMIKAALAPLEMKVITASSGAEGLRMLQSDTSPDLVVLDLLMPGMSGEQVLEQIRKEFPIHKLPVIVVSAKTPVEEVELKALGAGACDFLAKPFQGSMLRSRIRCLFNMRNWQNAQMSRDRANMFFDATMPPLIADRLRKGERKIADFHTKVAVLYLNVVSMESMCKNMKTEKAIDLIGSLSDDWGRLTEASGFIKKEAFGDAFMAVAGLDNSPNCVERLLNVALEMLKVVERTQEQLKDLSFTVRMALTTGPMTAGVVGSTKPRFCFFGETVNLCLRLENHGVPGCIQIDDVVQKELMHIFTNSHTHKSLPLPSSLMDRGRTEIAGRGMVHTWLIVPDGIKHKLPDIFEGTKVQGAHAAQAAPSARDFQEEAIRPSPRRNIERLHKPASSPLRVLSVDDDDINQEVIRGISDSEGFELTMAMDGMSCLQQIETAYKGGNLPDVLLLDCMMPGLSGMEVCTKLRENFTVLELPIVMLTCRSAPEELAAALDAGCNDYITKPFNRTELLARVRTQFAVKNCYLTALSDQPSGPLSAVPAVSAVPNGLQEKTPGEQHPVRAQAEMPPLQQSKEEDRLKAISHPQAQHVQLEEVASSIVSVSGLRESSVHVEILQKRVVSLRRERDELRRTLREQERQNVGMKAHLTATMTDVENAWKEVISKEEELERYKCAYEDSVDMSELRKTLPI